MGLICRLCGFPEDDHHSFEPIAVPEGCICSPADWRDPHAIPNICAAFAKGFPKDECETCAHDKECHK